MSVNPKTTARSSYYSMRYRCIDPKSNSYHRYGGRGVTICERWLEPNNMGRDNFLEDMGARPEGCSLDRIDNEGHYAPDNCRWATRLEQANNKRNNRKFEIDGVTKTLAEWSRESSLPSKTIDSRIRLGWNIVNAITTPSGTGRATSCKIEGCSRLGVLSSPKYPKYFPRGYCSAHYQRMRKLELGEQQDNNEE